MAIDPKQRNQIIIWSVVGLAALAGGVMMYRNYQRTGSLLKFGKKDEKGDKSVPSKPKPYTGPAPKRAVVRRFDCGRIPNLTIPELSKMSGIPVSEFIKMGQTTKNIIKARAIIAGKTGCIREYQAWLDSQAPVVE